MRGGILTLLLALALAGCIAQAPAADVQTASTSGAPATNPLAGAVEPEGLDAPTFALRGAIARGGPAYGAGEPGIATAPDGTIFVTFPGCDEGLGAGLFVGLTACPVGLVYRSADDGETWERLNDASTGELAEGAEEANGDADLAIDWSGGIFTSNLGDGIPSQRSLDGGETWEDTGNVVPEEETPVDRNWVAAGAAGHVIHNWMYTGGDDGRKIGVTMSRDAGDTWSNVTYLADDIGWQGNVQFGLDDDHAYIPYTEWLERGQVSGGSYALKVARTQDGGDTWEELDTGVGLFASETGFHFSGMLMVASVDVTSDGHLVVVWAEEVTDPLGLSAVGSVVKLVASPDGGDTWNEPVVVSTTPNAIMPWVVGGAGDRVGIAYLASALPGDPDRVGLWGLHVAMVDGLGEGAMVAENVVDPRVHEGGVCSSGGGCFIKGADRALLDYLEADMLPDGRMVVVYPADPLSGGKYIEIRVAVQDGGTLLVAP